MFGYDIIQATKHNSLGLRLSYGRFQRQGSFFDSIEKVTDCSARKICMVAQDLFAMQFIGAVVLLSLFFCVVAG
jgi:hypothetical protein